MYSAVSDLGLYCLLRPIFQNTKGNHNSHSKWKQIFSCKNQASWRIWTPVPWKQIAFFQSGFPLKGYDKLSVRSVLPLRYIFKCISYLFITGYAHRGIVKGMYLMRIKAEFSPFLLKRTCYGYSLEVPHLRQ